MAEPTVYESIDAYRLKVGQYIGNGLLGNVRFYYKSEYQVPGGRPYEYTWATAHVQQMPGCCGLAVSHDMTIHAYQLSQGLGMYLNREILNLINDSGYSCAICTVEEDKRSHTRRLIKNGWKKVHTFENRRTNHTVGIYVRDLAKGEKVA